MKHSKKVKLANKIMSKKEIKENTPIFQTENWKKRKEGKRLKVKNRTKIIQKNKSERLKKEKQKLTTIS